MGDRILEAIKDLRSDLAYVDAAIRSLEILAGRKSRRGRPPKILQEIQNYAGNDDRKPRSRPRKKNKKKR